MNVADTVTVGLIAGRHEIPAVTKYIFNSIDNVFDFKTMHEHIIDFLIKEVGIYRTYGSGINQNDSTDVEIFSGCKRLVVYVTGLTAVTAALIKCCAMNGVGLTLMHWDIMTQKYIPQDIF